MENNSTQIKCSEHKKICTDYCIQEGCNFPNQFICPRCISLKKNHVTHKDQLIEIDGSSSTLELLNSILHHSPSEISNLQKLQNIQQQNDFFIEVFTKLKTEINEQIKIQEKKRNSLLNSIIDENLSQYQTNIPSQQISNLIKAIKEKKIFESKIYDELKLRVERIYNKIGEKLSKCFENLKSTESIEDLKSKSKQKIEKQMLQVTQYQNNLLKQQKEMIVNLIPEREEEVNNLSDKNSNISQSEDNSQNLHQTNISISNDQLMDLFQSQIGSSSNTKTIKNPALNDDWNQKRIQQNKVQQFNNVNELNDKCKSDAECFEEKKQTNINSVSKSDGECHYKKKNQKQQIKKEEVQPNLLSKFTPKLEYEDQIEDCNIHYINIEGQIILFSYNLIPNILQFYYIKNKTIYESIEFKQGQIISAQLREDKKQVIVASESSCCVFNLNNNMQFTEMQKSLPTNPKLRIAKVQYLSNQRIVVLFNDYSIEIFNSNHLDRQNSFYRNNQNNSNSNFFFFYEIEYSYGLALLQNKTIQLFNLDSSNELEQIKEQYAFNSIEVSSNKKLIVTCGLSDFVTIYNYDSKQKKISSQIKISTTHKDEILQTKLINQDQWLVTISGDGTWKVFVCETGDMIYSQQNSNQNVITKCEYFPHSYQLLFIDQYGNLNMYTLQ